MSSKNNPRLQDRRAVPVAPTRPTQAERDEQALTDLAARMLLAKAARLEQAASSLGTGAYS